MKGHGHLEYSRMGYFPEDFFFVEGLYEVCFRKAMNAAYDELISIHD